MSTHMGISRHSVPTKDGTKPFLTSPVTDAEPATPNGQYALTPLIAGTNTASFFTLLFLLVNICIAKTPSATMVRNPAIEAPTMKKILMYHGVPSSVLVLRWLSQKKWRIRVWFRALYPVQKKELLLGVQVIFS